MIAPILYGVKVMPDSLGLPIERVGPRGTPEGGIVVQATEARPTVASRPTGTLEPGPITVSTAVLGLDGAQKLSNNDACVTVEDAAVRYWIGGRIPTATVGHPLEIGDILILENADELQDVQFIRRDAVDATLHVSYGNR